ncbi:MAG: asparagine synthase-related protein [Pseudomonadota bacterium]
MANWICILDDDADRRSAFVDRIKPRISPIGGLTTGFHDGGNWSVMWAAAGSAPVDSNMEEGGATFAWGEVRQPDGTLLDATAIGAVLDKNTGQQWDGYYSTIRISEHGKRLIVGADCLGLFPVYYWTDGGGVTLCGSSLELFRFHPLFQSALNWRGLVGILLTNGLVDGETMWQGVRRLGAGMRLEIDGAHASEVATYRLPDDGEFEDIPFRGHLKQLHETMQDTMSRHTAGDGSLSVMLSGGLDSRVLAGYLSDRGSSMTAITFGESQDHEMKAAASVARAIGAQHLASDIVDSVADAENLARWEHLAAGFCGLYEWGYHDAVAGAGDRIVVGHLLDRVVGGILVGKAYDSDSRDMSFEHAVSPVQEWCLDPETLKSMLPEEQRHLVAETLDFLRSHYESLSQHEHVRAWIFDLLYRQRFHVGGVLWSTSFGAWPVVPALDQKLLDVCAHFPGSTIGERRAQAGLVTTFFPTLARIPLDRNSDDTLPLTPSFGDFLKRSIGYRVERLKKTFGIGGNDPVFYRRIYDFESPRWRAIRQSTEANRALLHTHLDKDAVDALWPPAGQETDYENVIRDPNPVRLLIGLSIILRNIEAL